mmetsp:Transcript_7788/g.24121  ORF Transcript_7788/g.24121 Transcript_7788/m.24121 type:complete len:304 (+) Transcript_7788:872-1783(+)
MRPRGQRNVPRGVLELRRHRRERVCGTARRAHASATACAPDAAHATARCDARANAGTRAVQRTLGPVRRAGVCRTRLLPAGRHVPEIQPLVLAMRSGKACPCPCPTSGPHADAHAAAARAHASADAEPPAAASPGSSAHAKLPRPVHLCEQHGLARRLRSVCGSGQCRQLLQPVLRGHRTLHFCRRRLWDQRWLERGAPVRLRAVLLLAGRIVEHCDDSVPGRGEGPIPGVCLRAALQREALQRVLERSGRNQLFVLLHDRGPGQGGQLRQAPLLDRRRKHCRFAAPTTPQGERAVAARGLCR